MVREIMRDEEFLKLPSEDASKSDISIAKDLADTLKANADRCVGMAANMIGERKRITAFFAGKCCMVMINPVITKHSAKSYTAEEGCLSLEGKRSTTRYESIEVAYLDERFRKKKQSFSGFTAQIIQHELDHFEGKII